MANLFSVAMYLACARMLALTSADILPANGVKYVPYKVEVTSIPTGKDVRLAIFPWSTSNGAPTGEIKFVEANAPVRFGRRIAGSPAFWAVHSDKVPEIEAIADRGDPYESADAIAKWLRESGHATSCRGLQISPHFVAEAGEKEFVDRFAVKSFGADHCEIANAETFDASIKDDLGSYKDSKARFTDASEGAAEGRNESSSASWGSRALSVVALGAICALVWRMASVLRKPSEPSFQLQE